MCHKKINTNLEGQRPDFLCCKHSKKHVPKKKETKKIEKPKEEIIEKKGDIINTKRKDIKKVKKRKVKKVYVCNGGVFNLADIIKKMM